MVINIVHPRLYVLLTIVAVSTVASNVTLTIAPVRVATADDESVVQALAAPGQAWANREYDFSIGRFYSHIKFTSLEWLASVNSDLLHSTLRVAAFYAAVIALAWFAHVATGSLKIALLLVVVVSATVPVWIRYQALLSHPLLWIGWAAIWVVGGLALLPESQWSRLGTTIAFSFALIAHESNAVFIAWPAILKWSLGCNWIRSAFRLSLGSLLVLVAYGGLSLWLRSEVLSMTGGVLYQGASISFNIPEILWALAAYSFSGLPGLSSFVTHHLDGPLILSPRTWWDCLKYYTSPLAVLGSFFVSITVFNIFNSFIGMSRHGGFVVFGWRLWVGVIFAVFAPNFLLALTHKYQMWAHQRMWPYYYSSMSFMAWNLLLVVACLLLVRRAYSRYIRYAIGVTVLVFSFVAALSIAASNRRAAASLEKEIFYHTHSPRPAKRS